MKIAILSDIHSNFFALESVLEDVKTHGVDILVNLGDIFYGPIAPKKTAELLKSRDIVTIRGNQDRQIYEASPKAISDNPTMQFVCDEIGDSTMSWIKSLPSEIQLNDDIYLCHGSPRSDLDYLLEDIRSGYPQVRRDSEILSLLGGQTSQVIICGHTHIPRTVTLSNGQLVVNPGSVGLPAYTDNEPVIHSMENFSPHASYSIVEQHGESWNVNHIKVSYDHQAAAREAKKQHREDWSHFLTTGRGL